MKAAEGNPKKQGLMRITQALGPCHPPPRTSPVRVEIFLFSLRWSAGLWTWARRGSAIPLGPQEKRGQARGRPQTDPGARRPPEAAAGVPRPTSHTPQGPSSTFLSRSIKALLLPLESRFRFFSSARRSITLRSVRRRVPVSDEAELRAAAPAAPESPKPDRDSAIPGTLAPPTTSQRTRPGLPRLSAQNGAACEGTAPAAPVRLASAQAYPARVRRSRPRLPMRGGSPGRDARRRTTTRQPPAAKGRGACVPRSHRLPAVACRQSC